MACDLVIYGLKGSPFVRKVMAVLAIKQLPYEHIPSMPFSGDPELARVSPLGKVPALITDDGERLYDSPVICEYLDSLHDGARIFPPAGDARWRALRLQALADGILDAAILKMLEQRKRQQRA